MVVSGYVTIVYICQGDSRLEKSIGHILVFKSPIPHLSFRSPLYTFILKCEQIF